MYFFYYAPVGVSVGIRRFPFMTHFYAGLCLVIFVLSHYMYDSLPVDLYALMYFPPGDGVVPAITAAFLHIGHLHIIGNLVFLFVFGRYVEDRMGPHLFTLIFISAAGIGNYLQGVFNIHVLGNPNMAIAGASGAVSGLLGAFSVRFVLSNLRVAYWVFLPLQAYTRAGTVEMPAILAVVFWFLLQGFQSLVPLGGGSAQVAHITHISGFAVGAGIALFTGQWGRGCVEAMWQRARRHFENGEAYAAQGEMIRYLTVHPDNPEGYAMLARAMVLSGNTEGAKKNYRQACHMLLDQLRRGECEDVFQEALRGFANFHLDPAYHLKLAYGLERSLKPKLAIRAYRNFERRFPLHKEAPFALLRAAHLYRSALQSTTSADACYRKLIDKYPDDLWVDFARDQRRRLEAEGA
jgi:membrane associated rhomboid family serine protease